MAGEPGPGQGLCMFCGRPLPTRLKDIKDHIRTAHPEVWSAVQRRDVVALNNMPQRCNICDATMVSRQIKAHIRADHPEVLRHVARKRAYMVGCGLAILALLVLEYIFLLPLVLTDPSSRALGLLPLGLAAPFLWYGMIVLWIKKVEPEYLARAREEWRMHRPIIGRGPSP